MSHPKGCYGCGRKRCSAGPSWKPERDTSVVYSLATELLMSEAFFEGVAMAMDRSKAAGESPGTAFVDEEMMAEWPHLYEFMRETVWSDGKPRKTGTLTISIEGRMIKCSVHDRDGRRYGWLSSDTWSGLLKVINANLGDDGIEWRKDTR